MNKLNYLFADCVSHCNTLKINKQLNDFFDEEETKFFNAYYDSLPDRDDDDDDDDEYQWKPERVIPINSWDDALALSKWDDQWELKFNIPRRRRIYYKGYLYRKMSLTEFNRYLKGSLDTDSREWHRINHCSYNIGYCFLGDYSIGTMNDWRRDISLDDDMYSGRGELQWTLSHIGCGCSSYIYRDSYHMRYQEVYCKFYYEGPIWQSIAYYGEHDPYDNYYMNNYMIEYGLTDYSKLKLESVQVHVEDSRMCGMPHHGYKKVNC